MLLLGASFGASAMIVVNDDHGNRVVLAKPADRVVALAPHIVELIFAAGSGHTLVGAVSFSDYPEEAKQIPRVGNYKVYSEEAILRLKPDVVLALYSASGDQHLQNIKRFGIPVYFSEPRKLEDIGSAIARIGKLTGSTVAVQAQLKFERRLASLRQQYANVEPMSVFYQVWNQPLQTINGEHLISDVIRLCGGRNVFSEASVLAPKISVESVLRSDPQVIVASGMADERPEWLDEWHKWSKLQAVQNAQLKFIPPDLIQRHTPRVLQGAQMMCEHLQRARDHYLSAANKVGS